MQNCSKLFTSNVSNLPKNDNCRSWRSSADPRWWPKILKRSFALTHRCPGLRWRSAVWTTSAGPGWCVRRSSRTYGHKCVWRARRGRWSPVCRSCSSRTSRLKWLISCDRASAPSAAAPLPAACRSVSGGRPPSATDKQTPINVTRRTPAPTRGSSAGGAPAYRDVARVSVSFRADLDVAQMQDGGDDFEDVVLSAVLYSWKHTNKIQHMT